jgi:hypothetical protein
MGDVARLVRATTRAKSASLWLVSTTAEQRRAARANWEVRVFTGPTAFADQAEADEEFWLRIPVDERARAVWELSQELFALAEPESLERRFSRSDFRVTRR